MRPMGLWAGMLRKLVPSYRCVAACRDRPLRADRGPDPAVVDHQLRHHHALELRDS